MRMSTNKKRGLIILSVLLCIGLVAGIALGKYSGEFKNAFGLLISPIEQIKTDTTLRRYFRSNELLPASDNATYAINGTSGWFTVANALDTKTVSQDTISYTLTWYVSADGNTWTEHKKETGTFAKDHYTTAKYTVAPVTVGETVYNNVKVVGKTSSFLQEDIEAIYIFTYSDYVMETACSNGIITIKIDTNDMSGDYQFSWPAGIVPDNSDPNKIFTAALAGPSEFTANLKNNTAYEFLFFVTDNSLLSGSTDGSNIISVVKK